MFFIAHVRVHMRRGSRFSPSMIKSSVILVTGSVDNLIIRLPVSVSVDRNAVQVRLSCELLFFFILFQLFFGLSLQWQHQLHHKDSLERPQMALESI